MSFPEVQRLDRPIYNSEDREFESLGNCSELSDVKIVMKLHAPSLPSV